MDYGGRYWPIETERERNWAPITGKGAGFGRAYGHGSDGRGHGYGAKQKHAGVGNGRGHGFGFGVPWSRGDGHGAGCSYSERIFLESSDRWMSRVKFAGGTYIHSGMPRGQLSPLNPDREWCDDMAGPGHGDGHSDGHGHGFGYGDMPIAS